MQRMDLRVRPWGTVRGSLPPALEPPFFHSHPDFWVAAGALGESPETIESRRSESPSIVAGRRGGLDSAQRISAVPPVPPPQHRGCWPLAARRGAAGHHGG